MQKLITGELLLTLHILLGLVAGEIIIRLRLSECLMKRIMQSLRVNPVTGLALAVSVGSSKTGAAMIASALNNNTITERQAIYSVLMLSFPSYLRRWPGTLALSVSMAGTAGMFYALSQLVASVGRFIIAFILLKRGGADVVSVPESPATPTPHTMTLTRKLLHTLPAAWVFYGLMFWLVPHANRTLTGIFPGNVAIWALTAASVGRVSSALALAGGAMAAGELSTAGAVFGLVLGSGLGMLTRILRMNAGYYFGMFPARTAAKMILMNFCTIAPMIIMNLIFAGIALSF